jgi:hypothetical protein
MDSDKNVTQLWRYNLRVFWVKSGAGLSLEGQTVEKKSYCLAGLRVVSEFPLLGIQICRDEAAAHDNIVIRRAAISEWLASEATTFRHQQYIGKYNGKDVLLDNPGVGRFLVRGGKEILIDSAPDADEGTVRAYLVSMAFGALFHQRGIVPLHASAVDVADGCVAFVGGSGAGKSTLVAALAQRGHEVITDDVCFLQLNDNHDFRIWPGIGHIRLWEKALYALRCDGPGVVREMHGFNKYFIPVRPPQNPSECRPLRRVYQLDVAPDGAFRVTRVHGASAVEVLVQNVYQTRLAQHLGYKPRVFRACAAAARKVPVFRFSRPLDFDALSQGIEMLEDHMRKKS